MRVVLLQHYCQILSGSQRFTPITNLGVGDDLLWGEGGSGNGR